MKKTHPLERLLCVSVATVSLAAATPAMADAPGSWAGSYFGGHAGLNWSDYNSDDGISLMGGLNVGHNWQYNHFVYGLEGDFSLLDSDASVSGGRFEEDWMTTVRGRVGYSMERYLPYVTAGLGLTNTTAKTSAGASERVMPGLAIGGGLDYMLSSNWFGRLEYLHVDVPDHSSTIGNTTIREGSSNDAIRVGLNYKF